MSLAPHCWMASYGGSKEATSDEELVKGRDLASQACWGNLAQEHGTYGVTNTCIQKMAQKWTGDILWL